MAGPVTHIFLALQILQAGLLPQHDEKAFIIGTSFPDIRYLGVINRETTHQSPISWDNIANEQSSFKAGLKFHALVDEMREAFFIKENLYGQAPPSQYLAQSFKVAEDSWLYPCISEWDKIYAYFNTTLDEEQSFGMGNVAIKKWHAFLQQYLSLQKWHTRLRSYFFWKPMLQFIISRTNNSLNVEALSEILTASEDIERNTFLKEKIVSYYKNFWRSLIK